jgi:hypothetical protein
MFGNAMYFVAWYTLPFFRELNLYFYKFKFFVFILAPERHGDPATRACQLLANQCGGGCAFFPRGRGWIGGRGCRGVADPGRLEETSDYLHVSNFSFVLTSFSL